MMIEELIKYLDIPDNDYWSDEGCELARNVLDQNSELLFKELMTLWADWPEMRQEHLAYILGEGSSETELLLIKEMLTSPFSEVAYRAKESLREFQDR
ncbi:MAG: hypothetical protein PQJ50_10460 [Spirochaetales bacterium]|nr:hypothetical protein [Spirochaetales bacterium]